MSWERMSSQGIQSDIFIGEFRGQKAIKKISGRDLTALELTTVFSATLQYRRNLENNRICIPENLSLRIEDGHLETIDSFVKGRVIDGNNKNDWKAMVETIVTPRVYLDAKWQNFLRRDRVNYVDTFPPMLDDRGLISPWIPKVFKRDRQMMSFNFGDVRGRLTKLLSLVNLEKPQMFTELSKTTLDTAKGLIDRSHYDYVAEQTAKCFPDMQEMYKNPNNIGLVLRRING